MITLRLMKPQIPKLKALLKAAAESDIDMRILHDDLVYFIAKEKQKEDRRHLQRRNVPANDPPRGHQWQHHHDL